MASTYSCLPLPIYILRVITVHACETICYLVQPEIESSDRGITNIWSLDLLMFNDVLTGKNRGDLGGERGRGRECLAPIGWGTSQSHWFHPLYTVIIHHPFALSFRA